MRVGGLRRGSYLSSLCAALFLLCGITLAQDLAQRLILKDGSYQPVLKYEIKGDRVRYLSAERNEWEEVPNSLVDWTATEKYKQDRAKGVSSPEAAALDRELAAEKAAEEAKYPHVMPGLQLPEDSGGVLLLDTYKTQPQLIELQQNGGQVNKNTKSNMLKAAIIPIASAKQTIELAGPHASVQAHATLPSVYVNVQQQDQNSNADSNGQQQPQQPQQPWDRFKIVRMQSKADKRIVGNIKIAVYGKVSQEQSLVDTNAEQLTGGWVKVTPTQPLTPGEYAVVEMLGKDGMNLFVWDFGVNPDARENSQVIKPETSSAQPDQSQEPPKKQ
jgi:hypothetical protein